MPTGTQCRLPARLRPLAALLLLGGVAGLTGAAQPAAAQGSSQATVPGKPPFARMLIIGVSPHANQRCSFERFLASSMQTESPKTTAIASCDVMSTKDPLTRENIDRVVAEYQADSVLATALVAGKIGAAEGGGGRDTRGSGAYKAIDSGWAYYGGYYGVYGVPVIYGEFVTSPSIVTMSGEIEVVSRLYETRGATEVHVVTTKAKNLESRADALAELTPAIAKRLHRDGLID